MIASTGELVRSKKLILSSRAFAGKSSITTFQLTSTSSLWDDVAQSIANTDFSLRENDRLMRNFDISSSSLLFRIRKQFCMSLESGELAGLHQRISKLHIVLNLPYG